MTCDVEVDEAVDTGVSVSTSWRGPSGELASNSRVTISEVNVSDSENYIYESKVMISSLQSSDSGSYTCAATISPDPSAFIQESDSASDVIQLSVGKHVIGKSHTLEIHLLNKPCRFLLHRFLCIVVHILYYSAFLR